MKRKAFFNGISVNFGQSPVVALLGPRQWAKQRWQGLMREMAFREKITLI